MTILCAVGAIVSMMYATAFGGYLLGVVDTFINQIAILLAIVGECIVFAWIFKAEKLIDFLNERTKSIKSGKWWLAIVKYILPIVITVVWIGGMIDIINNGSSEQLIFTVITAAVLLIATLILTLAPAKNKDWTKADERV